MKAVMKAVEETAGPAGSIVYDVLKFNQKYEGLMPYIAGDKLSFSGLQHSEDFEFIEAEVVNVPVEWNDDENLYEDYNTKLCITVCFNAQKYKVNERQGKMSYKKN